MSDITLYMAPGTCARVTAISLHEIGLKFDTEVMRFMAGQHKSPEYKKLNPLGKVPALLIDNNVLTENVAIITYLNNCYGGLLPETKDAFEKTKQLADLCFCSSTLHPIVSRIRIPFFFTNEENASTVKAMACEAMDANFELIEARLEQNQWWYGDQWSAMDAYLYWVFWRVEGAGYEVARFPHFSDHARAMEKRDSVINTHKLESNAQHTLEKEGLAWVPPEVK
jgi:glutathione S-transferase